MKKRLVLLLLTLGVCLSFLSVTAQAGPPTDNTSTAVATCTNVTTSSVTVLPAVVAPARRIKWSIVTTSGAATIYFKEGTTATAPPGADSLPLAGGSSYTDDGPNVYGGRVDAIAKSGTVWICTNRVGG